MATSPKLKLVENTGSDLQTAAPEPLPQQEEMPFAVVEGEVVTELPRDLYIPPDALQVFLEAFEGPLDLLLYLIRRQNLDRESKRRLAQPHDPQMVRVAVSGCGGSHVGEHRIRLLPAQRIDDP